MEKYYLDKALNTAREMIHAYFDDKDINGVLKHLSAENFSFMGVNGDIFFDSIESYREYAAGFFNYIGTYEIIEEKYSIISESENSCLVLVQLKHIDTNTQNICELNYFFYFNQVDNRIICTHYYVSRPSKENHLIGSVFVHDSIQHQKIPSKIESCNDDLLEFINSDAVTEKSFYYERNFSYRLIRVC